MAMTATVGQRRWIFIATAVVIFLVVIGAILTVAELVAEGLEAGNYPIYKNQADATLGWLPKPGNYRYRATEYDTTSTINSLNMNDHEWTVEDQKSPVRILAVGNSHTFAIGVSTNQTWPKRVEAALFSSPRQGVVMNAGVIGYNVGQYLLRYRLLREKIKPTVLLVGFSLATDVYNLIPPERGGFIYGYDADRVFFDIDSNGKLIERVYRKSATAGSQKVVFNKASTNTIVNYLGQFALYRRLKRSSLAMTVATYFHPGGNSFWPGMDTVLKKDLNAEDRYRWRLVELIIAKMATEAKANNTKIALVNIPYIAQVYDEVWASSFGRRPNIYDRHIPSSRLKAICDRYGVTFIDTTDAFVKAARERKHWLHWRIDGHPTPEGQQVIADVVAANLKNTLPSEVPEVEVARPSSTIHRHKRFSAKRNDFRPDHWTRKVRK